MIEHLDKLIQGQEKLQPQFHEHLKVILLGTGSPRAVYGVSKPGVAVLAGHKVFLVDCGAGTVNQLLLAGIMPQRISDVLFTHHHSDHNSGFFDVFISSWRTHVVPGGVYKNREVPMQVYGPETTEEIIGRMEQSFAFDVNLRINYNKSAFEGSRIVVHACNEGVVYDQDGIKITAFEVDHRPVYPAIAYRFDYNGQSVVISGDTLPVDNMVKYAKDTDLLVHEAYNKAWLDALIEMYPEERVGLNNPAKYHTTTLEAADIAQRAGAKHLLLTHHIPAPAKTEEAEAAYIAGMSERYDGPITVGRDLMEIDLGAGRA
ncbi:ribonuclease Z [Paenibacillus sp. UNCCL117]|uniref:MBL fold metallo-hydrolase n=1 Tax=unclassified Paenibacillus TaxID=185978 RepID=UPI00088B7FD1|nr:MULTISPECIES: MBL fold metallo-hydrolase [unclassified Paenibacillus]SDC92306.1 ribonuclease Z [Paenibacillus sp. cl123]SFW29309.1 ribonuclease Z [Paenibacillus sp. UNCCL117]